MFPSHFLHQVEFTFHIDPHHWLPTPNKLASSTFPRLSSWYHRFFLVYLSRRFRFLAAFNRLMRYTGGLRLSMWISVTGKRDYFRLLQCNFQTGRWWQGLSSPFKSVPAIILFSRESASSLYGSRRGH